jgi:hypothetical protein
MVVYYLQFIIQNTRIVYFIRPVPLVCGTHFLISEVLKSRPEVNLLNRVDETPDDDIQVASLETFFFCVIM